MPLLRNRNLHISSGCVLSLAVVLCLCPTSCTLTVSLDGLTGSASADGGDGCPTGYADCNDDRTKDGCETNIASDTANCGGCKHSCKGADCKGGYCVASDLYTSETPDGVFGLAIDDTRIYFTTKSEVLARAKDPSSKEEPVYLVDSQSQCRGIAVDDTTVFWTTDAGLVSKHPKTPGGPPTTLASSQGSLTAITVDSTNVYWVTPADGVRYLSKSGGEIHTVPDSKAGPSALAVQGNSIFWIAYGQTPRVVKMATIGGTTATTLCCTGSDELIGPTRIAVDQDYVYVTEQGTDEAKYADGKISRFQKTQNATKELVKDSQNGAHSIVVDTVKKQLFWTNFNGNTVVSLPIPAANQPASATLVLAGNQSSAKGIVVDDAAAYWISAGTIRRIPR